MHLSVGLTRHAAAQAHPLVAASGPATPVPPGWEAHPVGLEELVLAYLRAPSAADLPRPSLLQHTQPTEATR
jgi:ABC-2 type transport system ATP-binding protein